MTIIKQDIILLFPILFLFFSIFLVSLFFICYSLSERRGFPLLNSQRNLFFIVILLFTLALCINDPFGHQFFFFNFFYKDALGSCIQVLVISITILLILSSSFFLERERYNSFEPLLLMAIATLAMLVLSYSNDLILTYLCIELQSFCFYILAALRRKDIRSLEAGLKYFILGSFSSSFLLFGISLLYGLTGLTNLNELMLFYNIFVSSSPETFLLEQYQFLYFGSTIATLFIFVGLFFKIYAAPFHFWIVDIYQGAPTFVTAYFASVPNIPLLYLIVKLGEIFFVINSLWYYILLFCALLSMLLGTLGALYQKLIKKLIAYSAIGHTGYFLTLVLMLQQESIYPLQYLLTYMTMYSLTTLGIFTVFMMLEKHTRYSTQFVESLHLLAGLYKRNKLLAIILSLLLFSIAGIPPLPGFIVKLFLFTSILSPHYRFLLFLYVMLIAVASCFYYVRIIKLIYFSKAKEWPFYSPLPYSSSAVLMCIFCVLIGFLIVPEYFQVFFYYVSSTYV